MSIQELKKSESGPEEQELQSAPAPATASDSRRPMRHFRLALIAVIALILFGGLMLAGVLPRLARQKKITAESQAILDSIPNVSVVQAQLAPASSDLHNSVRRAISPYSSETGVVAGLSELIWADSTFGADRKKQAPVGLGPHSRSGCCLESPDSRL